MELEQGFRTELDNSFLVMHKDKDKGYSLKWSEVVSPEFGYEFLA